MKILSLFDGMSCGQIALERAGVSVDGYYASEIDKYAISITQKNYPNTIQIGDVTKLNIDTLPKIDLLLGGSPCQGFSFAGDQLAFDDPRSKLFFDYCRILNGLKLINPNIKFLLENVKMKKEYLDIISDHLGVKPIKINSNLVSAQNRERYYWTNIEFDIPEDKNILLWDILGEIGKEDRKSFKLHSPRETKNYWQFDVSGKGHNSQQDRAYKITGKFGCFPNARAITKRKIYMGNLSYRDLTLNECESLQTVPHNYTFLKIGFSLNKSLSALGNGWTVDVIAHILKGLSLDNSMK